MRIDKKLNLIVPISLENGETVYCHSMPILKETFQRYSLVIAATFSKLLVNGLQSMGARIAAFALQEIAEEMGRWEGVHGVKEGLLNEIDRLTNVLAMGSNGWESIPVETAISRGALDAEDYEEAKQKIVFFYLNIGYGTAGRGGFFHGHSGERLGNAYHALELYGIRQFIEDIDRDRDFSSGRESIINECLDYLSGEGFSDLMRDVDSKYKDNPYLWRQRYLIETLRTRM